MIDTALKIKYNTINVLTKEAAGERLLPFVWRRYNETNEKKTYSDRG